jgi:hypothetical protein
VINVILGRDKKKWKPPTKSDNTKQTNLTNKNIINSRQKGNEETNHSNTALQSTKSQII